MKNIIENAGGLRHGAGGRCVSERGSSGAGVAD